MLFHDLSAALSLIFLFCLVDTGMRVIVSVVFVFVVSFLCVFRPQYCNLLYVNCLPCSLTLKLF